MGEPAETRGVTAHAVVLDRVVAALRDLPIVAAIGAYGSTADRRWTPYSDIDLLAVLNVIPPVESLRFFVSGLAVDLNFRAADDSDRGIGGADFVPEATMIWDPEALLARSRATRRTHNPEATAAVRYLLFHDIQKIHQIGDWSAQRAAMGGVVDQVFRAWFQTRAEPYPGVIEAIDEVRARDPRVLELIDEALTDGRRGVAALLEAAQRAAEPAGGIFSPGEVLAVSWRHPKVEPVPDAFRSLVEIADLRP